MRENWNQGILWMLPLVAFVVLAALPAQSAGAQDLTIVADAEVAAMAIHGDSVSFSPRVDMEEMTLSVAGGGHFSTQSFRGGQAASFAPVDSQGFQLPDGTYKWELVVSPRPEDLDLRAFTNGTISADGRTIEAAQAPEGRRQSGVFTIKNGVIVDPSGVEPEATRAAGSIGGVSQGEQPSAVARSAEATDRDGN